jgi:hypothetical protein
MTSPSSEVATIGFVAIATELGKIDRCTHRWDAALGQILGPPVPGLA